MRKKLLAVLLVSTISIGSAFAADSSINRDPTLHQAQSCAEVETALKDYLQTRWNAGQFGPVARGGVMMNDSSTKAALESTADGM
ncbi:hypothetical protein KA478_00170 [Patescibacteria group bacterium]|nr:hypothetical protein [Patescibacteria group bacterium]